MALKPTLVMLFLGIMLLLPAENNAASSSHDKSHEAPAPQATNSSHDKSYDAPAPQATNSSHDKIHEAPAPQATSSSHDKSHKASAPQPQPPSNFTRHGITQGSLLPQECGPRCNQRCSNTQYKKPCLFFCNKCCAKCLCVPPGTYGNKEVCPCYNNWKTKRGGPKCP